MGKKLQLIGLGIILGLIVTGVILLVSNPPHGKPVILLPTETPGLVTIYINGAVVQPGVYSLEPGSRIEDALTLAGGFTPEANKNIVNLAEILQDEDFVHIPAIGEDITTNNKTTVEGNSDDGIIGLIKPVDINHATIEQLMTIPGIGPTKSTGDS